MSLRKIKRFLKKENISKLCYLKFIEKFDIDDKSILLDSQHGANLNGNIFYLLKELHKEDYNDYKLYVAVNKQNLKDFKSIIEEYNNNNAVNSFYNLMK